MNENSEPTFEDILDEPLAPSTMTPFQCPKCPKQFRNANGLRMHDGRVHTGLLGSGYSWKSRRGTNKKMTQEERLEKRREYSRQWRLKRGMKANPQNWKGTTTGTTWSPERRARFERTWRRKRKQELERLQSTPVTARKRIRYIYPDPNEAMQAAIEATPNLNPQPPPMTAEMKAYLRAQLLRYCPKCGEHLEQWNKEINANTERNQ